MLNSSSIIFQDVFYYYGKSCALRNISLCIPQGRLLAIKGPNGGGKSTFLKLIAGFIKPSSGTIIVPYKNVAYLPQHNDIDKKFPLTVFDVISMALWHISPWHSYHDMKRQVESAMDHLQLTRHQHKNLSELSGGELQRVLFGRMQLQKADLILLDEPFTAIDEASFSILMDSVNLLHQQGKTVLVIIHQSSIIKKYFENYLTINQTIQSSIF